MEVSLKPNEHCDGCWNKTAINRHVEQQNQATGSLEKPFVVVCQGRVACYGAVTFENHTHDLLPVCTAIEQPVIISTTERAVVQPPATLGLEGIVPGFKREKPEDFPPSAENAE